jgi:hypothetical protein
VVANLDDVLTKAKTRATRALDDEDAAQDVVIQLWVALSNGKMKSDEEINRYLRAAINNQKNRLLRGYYTNTVELDESLMVFEEDDRPSRDYTRFTDEEKGLISLLAMGYSVAEMSSATGFGRSTIYRKIESMKGKLIDAQ